MIVESHYLTDALESGKCFGHYDKAFKECAKKCQISSRCETATEARFMEKRNAEEMVEREGVSKFDTLAEMLVHGLSVDYFYKEKLTEKGRMYVFRRIESSIGNLFSISYLKKSGKIKVVMMKDNKSMVKSLFSEEETLKIVKKINRWVKRNENK